MSAVLSKETLESLIFDVIDEINRQLSSERHIEKSGDAFLFGEKGKLDSLGLVNLIVETERRVEDEFGVSIELSDEDKVAQAGNPFQSVGSLVDYVLLLLKDKV
ncbi:MAG: acyl carrier protein [Planctomycetota bacterium]|jgi:acyl carrier protein